VGKRQQQGPDWFQDPAAAGRIGGGSPLESAFASLKTAGDILSWVVTEAEVRREGCMPGTVRTV
jgi:hypothetical protein